MHASRNWRAHANTKKWGAVSDAPLWGQAVVLRERICESGGDLGEPGSQCCLDRRSTCSTEHSSHCANDTNGDDDVFERHDAVLVPAQTLQSFGGLDIIFQHGRKSFYKVCCCMLATFIGALLPTTGVV